MDSFEKLLLVNSLSSGGDKGYFYGFLHGFFSCIILLTFILSVRNSLQNGYNYNNNYGNPPVYHASIGVAGDNIERYLNYSW